MLGETQRKAILHQADASSNAFTPHGNCDPLSIASLGVGIYQAGTKQDTEVLYVSRRFLPIVRQWRMLKRGEIYGQVRSMLCVALTAHRSYDVIFLRLFDPCWET